MNEIKRKSLAELNNESRGLDPGACSNCGCKDVRRGTCRFCGRPKGKAGLPETDKKQKGR